MTIRVWLKVMVHLMLYILNLQVDTHGIQQSQKLYQAASTGEMPTKSCTHMLVQTVSIEAEKVQKNHWLKLKVMAHHMPSTPNLQVDIHGIQQFQKHYQAANTGEMLTKSYTHMLVQTASIEAEKAPKNHWYKKIQESHGTLILLEAAPIENQLML